MTPAEQLVMAITSPVLAPLDAHERLLIAIDGIADARFTALSSGERAIMRTANALDGIRGRLCDVDEVWQERIGDALSRTAGTAYAHANGSALQHRYLIDEDGAA